MFVIEFMDDVAESVEGFCFTLCELLIKPILVLLIQVIIILSYPVWIIPYKIFRKSEKNQKSAEAYASEGEEKC